MQATAPELPAPRPADEPPTAPRRPRWPLVMAAGVLAAVALWSLLAVAVPPLVVHVAQGAAQEALGRPLTIGAVRFRPWSLALELDDVALHGPATGASAPAPTPASAAAAATATATGTGTPTVAAPAASAPFRVRAVRIDLALASLRHLAPVVDRLAIESPSLAIVRRADGSTDWDDVLQRIASRPAAPDEGGPARYAVYNATVRDGAVDLDDRTVGRRHRLDALEIGLPFASTLDTDREVLVAPRLAFALDGSRFESSAEAAPFGERGQGSLRLAFQDVELGRYAGYLPDGTPVALRGGRLGADLTVAFVQRPRPTVQIGGSLALRALALDDRAGRALLRVGIIDVALDSVRPLERSARIARIAVDAPHAVAVRDASGHIDLLLAADAPDAEGPAPARVASPSGVGVVQPGGSTSAGEAPPSARRAAPSGTPSSAPAAVRVPLPTSRPASAASGASASRATAASPGWTVAVAAVALRAGTLDWQDRTTAPAARATLADVAFDAESLGWPLAAPVLFRGEGRLAGTAPAASASAPAAAVARAASTPGATIAFEGQGDARAAEVAVRLDGVPLAAAAPYLRAVLVPPLDGRLGARATVRWSAAAASAPDARDAVAVDVERLAVDGLRLGDARAPLVAAERVELTGARIDGAARRAELGRIALVAPAVALERDAAKRWSPTRWTVEAAASGAPSAPAAARPAPAASAAAWQVGFDAIGVERGRMRIADAEPAPGAAPLALDVDAIELRLAEGAVERRRGDLTFRVAARVRPAAATGGALPVARPASAPSARAADAARTNRGSTARAPGTTAAGGGPTAGSLLVEGRLTHRGADGIPTGVAATVALRELPLQLADPYLAGVLAVEVQRATGGFTGRVEAVPRSAGTALALAGDLALDDVRVAAAAPPGERRTDPGAGRGGRRLLEWKSLALRGVDLAVAPGTPTRLAIADVALADFFARAVLDESGRLNLQDVARPSGPPAAASAASAPASAASAAAPSASAPATAVASAPPPTAAPTLDVRIGGIAVANGRVVFNDRFVRPNYTADLTELAGRIGAFSTASVPGAPPALAEIRLAGRVEGTATLAIEGRVNPLARPLALDLAARVRDLELPPLSPYAIKYAGYGIERGKMSVDLAYKVQPDGTLTASNRIVLNQLAFGDKAEGATASLPVKLAVALLADRNGVIDLDLPISGSINDPQFSIGGIVWKAITNLIVKAVTAPFSLLASAFGDGGGATGEPSAVAFAPGSAVLDDAARERLDRVAAALAERPQLVLTVTGESRAARELDAWKAERLAQQLRAEKRRQAVAGGAPAGVEVTVSPEERPALLRELYRRSDVPGKPVNALGFATDVPPERMEALLLQQIVPPEDALRQLAVRRAVAVRDHLAAKQVPASRVFVGAPRLAPASGGDDAGWTPRAELRLGAS